MDKLKIGISDSENIILENLEIISNQSLEIESLKIVKDELENKLRDKDIRLEKTEEKLNHSIETQNNSSYKFIEDLHKKDEEIKSLKALIEN